MQRALALAPPTAAPPRCAVSSAVSCVSCTSRIAYRCVSWGSASTHTRTHNSSSSPAQPSPGTPIRAYRHEVRVGISNTIFSSPPCAACLLPYRVQSSFSLTLGIIHSSKSRHPPRLPHLSPLIFRLSPLTSHTSSLTSQSSVPTALNSRHQASQPHDEALPFVLARAGPIRPWRRFCAPPRLQACRRHGFRLRRPACDAIEGPRRPCFGVRRSDLASGCGAGQAYAAIPPGRAPRRSHVSLVAPHPVLSCPVHVQPSHPVRPCPSLSYPHLSLACVTVCCARRCHAVAPWSCRAGRIVL